MSRAFFTYLTLLVIATGLLILSMYVFSKSGYTEIGLAATIALVGVGTIVIAIAGLKKERRELALYRELSNRSRVKLPITEIRSMPSEANEHVTMHVIVCRVLDRKGKILSEFTSVPLKKDPRKALMRHKEVDIYVDPCDVKNYYMDVSFL